MTRISTFCVWSSTLAVIALSANGASAVNITVHTTVPRVIVHVPQPKVTVHTPQLKTLGNHGTVVGTKSGSNHVLLKGGSGEIANKKIDSSAIQSMGFPSLDAASKNRSTISIVNPVPPFSFNKIDPAANASVVSVLQVGAQSSGAGAGKSVFNTFTAPRVNDIASPSLFQAALSNGAVDKVTLSVFRPNKPTPQTPRIEKLNTHRVEK